MAALKPKHTEAQVNQLEFTSVQNSITTYAENTAKEITYKIDDQQLKDLESALNSKVKTHAKHCENAKQEILKIANKLPSDALEAVRLEAKRAGGKKELLSIDSLIISYLQNNGSALLQQNPSLTEAEIAQLSSMLRDYLSDTTELNHLQSLHDKCLEAQNVNIDVQQKNNLLDEISKDLQKERAYKISTVPRAVLVF